MTDFPSLVREAMARRETRSMRSRWPDLPSHGRWGSKATPHSIASCGGFRLGQSSLSDPLCLRQTLTLSMMHGGP